MDITFIHTGGPYGDATSNYEVRIPEDTTVAEFIKYIVRVYSVEHGEWGEFRVYGLKEHPHGHGLISYNRGEAFFEPEPWRTPRDVCEPLLKELQNRVIKKVKANGGWSCMGYDLYLEGEEK